MAEQVMISQRLAASESKPKVKSPYLIAVSAKDPSTNTPAAAIVHPPKNPDLGPMARVTQENVVPQSGSRRFRYMNANDVKAIGMKEMISTNGVA